MENELHLFKIKLQALGALRPEAWGAILALKQELALAPNESFVRREGSLALVALGVLKEYDIQCRSKPAIVNFIGENQCFITSVHQQNHYLEACTPCQLYYWNEQALQQLYQEFAELKLIYNQLCAQYDAQLWHRMRLLEMPVQERLDTFRATFTNVLPYLKKKDIANYLHLNYTHLVKSWNG
ncbi:MAG: Crp/Fnr family transcriptional regulator [Sphingobacteriales bacterium]|nr:MAG: Crp/Fnr family transcriptional regulator [Sphingobacteriales bacterium]